MENPLQYFAELSDPRVEGRSDHLLEEILLITIAAVLSGADSWNEIEDYGKAKQEWLGSFLRLPQGIPSHDTFNRVFSLLDPAELETCFLGWVSSIAQMTAGEVVAIDGKSLRGTREGGKKTLVHMVSAWANSNNLVLGQQRVDEKSNEITAIPKLLKVLELSGTIVTIDAMGCQKSIAQQILDKQADYVLAVKENQLHLLEDMRDSFKCCRRKPPLKSSIVVMDAWRPVAARSWATCRWWIRLLTGRGCKLWCASKLNAITR